MDAKRTPSEALISGWATFSGAIVTSAGDPDNDGESDAEEASAELIGADLIYRVEQEDLLARLRVSSLPASLCGPRMSVHQLRRNCVTRGGGVDEASSPRTIYGMEFQLEGVRYEARARSGFTAQAPSADVEVIVQDDPAQFALYRCDLECVKQKDLSGGIGTTGNDVRIAVPLAALDATEGMTITGVRAFAHREDEQETVDETDLPDARIPVSQVTLGAAPIDVPQSEVTFTTSTDLTQGKFFGRLDTASGPQRVWARVCLGQVCRTHAAPMPARQ